MNGGRDKVRVLWLLNHRTARNFDVQMLSLLGADEVFTPKAFPIDARWVSADIDRSLDAALTIPPQDLALLNAADWYGNAGEDAWRVANRYFQIAFVGFHLAQLDDVIRHFASTVLLRAWGHFSTASFYSDQLYRELGTGIVDRIRDMGDRFWFAHSYERIEEVEHDFLRRRSCYLPLGLVDAAVTDRWRGDDARIFFVCPQIGTEPYYEAQYANFLRDFSGLRYAIGGPQPIAVPDPNVIGLLPRAAHDENMRRFRVMYYSGTHPFHVHYHPFEAVRAGMPLVFMAGSLLDQLGGQDLPGRCRNVKEARRKIERLLAGDDRLARDIRNAQARLLEKMRPEYCAPIWRRNFAKIRESCSKPHGPAPRRRPKIAVILTQEYRGGTLRAAKSIASALHIGSRGAGEPADIVLAHLDAESYPDTEFRDLVPEISRRPYVWQLLEGDQARRVLNYRGQRIALQPMRYGVPDDGINNFLDCDFWVMISDRFDAPLLPIRKYALVVFDYLQRYQPIMEDGMDVPFLQAARSAAVVMVTTRFTRNDAAQYAGVDPRSIRVLPHIIPDFPEPLPTEERVDDYFVWSTNMSVHKNHLNALRALRLYYEELNGSLKCRVTGVETQSLFLGEQPHLEAVRTLYKSSAALRSKIEAMGELPDSIYQKCLANSRFLWHAASVDNGTFAAVEAASVGVPTLSTRYPAMQEMNDDFGLNIAWCDPNDPHEMAAELKQMEGRAVALRRGLPSRDSLRAKGLDSAARAYWQVVRECL